MSQGNSWNQQPPQKQMLNLFPLHKMYALVSRLQKFNFSIGPYNVTTF